MANFDETGAKDYNWSESGVYLINETDFVEGGPEGISNRQGRELTTRTRNLHERLADLKTETSERHAALEEDLDIKTKAAIRSSKEYTDTTAVAVRSEIAAGDAIALRDAKSYADRIVAALIDGSPELLNTLEELAGALGNDPNFATTVTQQIGERVKTIDFNTAISGKANTNHSHDYAIRDHGHTATEVADVWHIGNLDPMRSYGTLSAGTNATAWLQNGGWHEPNGESSRAYVNIYTGGSASSLMFSFDYWSGELYWKNSIDANRWSGEFKRIYHTGNLGNATYDYDGLMRAGDKKKLDAMSHIKIYAQGKVLPTGEGYYQTGLVNVRVTREPGYSTGVFRLTHDIGVMGYCIFITLTTSVNRSLTYRVLAETSSFIIVRVHDVVNFNSFMDCEFDYLITGA